MKNTVVEDTHKLYTAVVDKQDTIGTLTETLMSTAELLLAEIEEQKVLFAEAQRHISDNEKFHRDTLHLLELSEELSSVDKLELYELLDSAVQARRLGKDLLTGAGMSTNKVTNLFNQGSNTIANMNANSFKVLALNLINRAKVVALLKDINTSNLRIQYPTEGRCYRVRSEEGSQQHSLIRDFVQTRKLSKKKFTKFVLHKEVANGTTNN